VAKSAFGSEWPIRSEVSIMTPPAFTPTNTNVQIAASKRQASAGRVASNVGRIVSGAVAVVGKAIVNFADYRAALKRLEARGGNLFDEPVLWAEIKSVAWAEAGEVAEQWKDRLPLIGAWASGAGFLLVIFAAALWTL
jgi:hypothetical protein